MAGLSRLFAGGTTLAWLGAALLVGGFFAPWFHTTPCGGCAGTLPVQYFSPPLMLTVPPANTALSWWMLPVPIVFLFYMLSLLGAGSLGVVAVLAAARRMPDTVSDGLMLVALVASVVGPYTLALLYAVASFAVMFNESVGERSDVGPAVTFAGYSAAFVAAVILLCDRLRALRETPVTSAASAL